jgi:phosphoribosylformylglycinamidine synthase subunit PurS
VVAMTDGNGTGTDGNGAGTRFSVRVDVTHLPGVLDPQGATVERALPALGYANVSDVSISKTIRLALLAPSAAEAAAQVDEMCRRLLANPVIERYTVVIEPEGAP